MANKQKGVRRNYLRLLISLFIVIIITVLGTVAINLTPKELRSLFPIVWLSSLALLILLFIFNKIALKVYTSQFKNKTAAERQDYILAIRSNVGDDLFAEAKRMKRLRILLEAFITVAVCLLVLLAITSGAVTKGFTVMLFIFFVTYALDGALALIPKPITKKTFEDYTKPEDYPHIHSLARRAADTLGLKGTIRIAIVDSYDAAIARLGRTYSIILGVRLLDILSEDELYNILLHEFGHMTKKADITPREGKLWSVFNSIDSEGFSIFNQFICFSATLFMTQFSFYSIVASIHIEREADRAVVEHGSATDAAQALVKIHLETRFSNELDEFNPFEPNEPMTNLVRTYTDLYKKALRERGEFWLSLAKNEIEPRSASHPILRNRLEPLGVTDPSIVFPEDDGSVFRCEVNKAFDYIEDCVSKALAEGYKDKRHHYYVLPFEEVKRWEANGCDISPEESRPVIEALCEMNKYTKAEELCDKIIAEAENKFATAHAHYMKGYLLSRRYDKACLDHLYAAMELNNNYIESALNLIGEFCCMMGLQTELDEYRERAVQYAQKADDEESTGFDDGKLLPHSLSEEKLNTILDYIKAVDEKEDVSEVLCIDHVTSKKRSETAFVLVFKDLDTDSAHTVYDKLFNLLDTDPDGIDYSLSVYDDKIGKMIRPVKGSTVYKRD